jgi:chitinase
MRLYALGAASFMAVAWAPAGATAASNVASNAAQEFLANLPFDIVPAPASVLQPDRAAIKAALLAGNYTSKLNHTTRMLCPSSCSAAGADSSHWFAYHDVGRLNQCNETMLVDFSLLSELNDPGFSNKILACTADLNTSSGTASKNTTCPQNGVNNVQVTSSMQMVSSGASSDANLAAVADTLAQLQASYGLSEPSCNETIRYAYSKNAAVGVYVGSKLASQDVLNSVFDQLSATLNSDGGVPESVAVQLCEDRSSRYSLGVFISTQADLSAAQHAVQTWKNGSCLATMEKAVPAWHNITFLAPSLGQNGTATSGNATLATRTLSARGTCTTLQVHSGDTCSSLATECGITAAQFTQYNPAANECSTLAVGEYVCCSSGTLPDNTPKPDSAGNCFSYLVVSGDTCSAIAASHDITVDEINSWNTQTWGWTGCSNLFVGDLICLSTGYPPMPANLPNAVCGPQVNNTATAPHGTDFSTLNECPLNACCDIWGQCGTTAEFCTKSNSSTGNPGTAAPGQNGCISNCGTNIVSSPAPASTFNIAYWEGFDWSRPCLNEGVQKLNASAYTHVHFGFAGINPDWSINTTSIDPRFPFLQDLQGVKKIISIGGWDFSTDPSTYTIFRNVVASESSRSTLVSNIVSFLNTNNLDGVDIDWEYPDEPDIPGIPAGTKAESTGFYLLLEELKVSIASNAPGKTISITAPASFWYLQHFPILALSSVVDYIVYMTYDLHGQWDYGRAYSDPGCPGGNCLRSHVNLTESINALSMITKAGVPSNMVAVGVSSYARTFGMITPGCWTEMCTYDGPDSGALPGPCTDTAGYLANYELDLVIADNPSAEQYWDASSWSNILVYNQTQWGAYMNDTNKAARKFIYSALGFLGSSDWAVDLQSEFGGDIAADSGSSTVYISPDIWSSASAELTMLPGVTLIWPPKPLGTTTTISFPLWTTTVSYSSLTTLTSTLTDGSKSTYPWYIYISVVTVITIPPGEICCLGYKHFA